jgi:hypothetical protein
VTDAKRMQNLIREALQVAGGNEARAARLLKEWATDDPEVREVIRKHMASTSWPEITRVLIGEGFDVEETGS